MNTNDKILIDQTFKQIERALKETPSRRAHHAFVLERRTRRRERIRQYIDAQPKPTPLTDAQMWELAGLVGCTMKKLRQELAVVLLDPPPNDPPVL